MISTLAHVSNGLQQHRAAPHDRLYVTLYWLTATGLIGWLGWTVFSYPVFTQSLNNDFWEHSAAIREWMADLWHPKNPHLATDTGSPRYMPFYFVLAAMGKMLGLQAIDTLRIGAVFNVAFLSLGAFLFFRLYFRHSLAPLVGLVVLLTGWGMAWTWSNVYQLRGLLYVAPYPSTFSFAATLVCLWLQTSLLRSDAPSIGKFIGLAVLIALAFASHPLTGALAVGAAGLLALTHPNVRPRTRITAIAALGAGLLLAELWPYYSIFQVTLGVSGGEAKSWVNGGDFAWDARPRELLSHPFYAPTTVLAALGPALAGFLCLIFLCRKREYRFILFGALSMLLPYFINLIYPIPLGHRFLLFAIFFLHLAMIWAALDLIQRLAQTGAASLAVKLAAGFMGTVLAGGLAFNVAFAQFDYRRHVANWQPVPATIGKVVRSVPANGVVMAQPMLAWPIPTFGGKVISLFHPNPMVPDQADRKRDVARFFDAETPVTQRRHILHQYGATHVLIDTTDTADSVLTYLYLNGTITETMDTLQLIALSSPSS